MIQLYGYKIVYSRAEKEAILKINFSFITKPHKRS